MPTVTVLRDRLFDAIGRTFEKEKFDELCFEFGLEFDGEENDEQGRLLYRIEIAANRYDLLCLEGLADALRSFLGIGSPPNFRLSPSGECHVMTVLPETAKVRPFVVGAVLRNINFDADTLQSFIDLQEKLHQNICRKRRLVAIGTHDLDTLRPPFEYSARPPSSFEFQPLNHAQSLDGNGIMSLYENHQQLKSYLPIIRDSPIYPLVRDSSGRVLSMPPIINSNHSKIHIGTRNVLIECTATDLTKAEIVLNCVVTAFSRYCDVPFTVEPMAVEYSNDHASTCRGLSTKFPNLESRTVISNLAYIKRRSGVPHLTSQLCCDLLAKMSINSVPHPTDPTKIVSLVGPTRSDILHPCDLAEDVSISFGFNNIVSRNFNFTSEQPIQALSDMLRREIANCGFNEALSWGLCSYRDCFDSLNRQETSVPFPIYCPNRRPIRLSNPKTKEFEIVRTSLLPGLLRTLAANKAMELPIRLFEVGDVASVGEDSETRTSHRRYCAALISNNIGSGLEEIHGLLDHLLSRLQLVATYDEKSHPSTVRKYSLVPALDAACLPGRVVDITVGEEVIGRMGVLHPTVIKGFGLGLPTAMFEFILEPFLEWLPETDLYDC